MEAAHAIEFDAKDVLAKLKVAQSALQCLPERVADVLRERFLDLGDLSVDFVLAHDAPATGAGGPIRYVAVSAGLDELIAAAVRATNVDPVDALVGHGENTSRLVEEPRS